MSLTTPGTHFDLTGIKLATARKLSLQPAHSVDSYPVDSYPMLASRTDATPSARSSPASNLPFPFGGPKPPVTTPAPVKARPPPLKIASSNHASFLTPLLERPFKTRFGKDKAGDKAGDSSGGEEEVGTSKLKAKRGKDRGGERDEAQARLVEVPALPLPPVVPQFEGGAESGDVDYSLCSSLLGDDLQNQRAFFAQFPEEDDSTLAITLEKSTAGRADLLRNVEGRRSAAGSTHSSTHSSAARLERIPVPSLDALRFDALFPHNDLSTPRRAPRRRASSFDESPKLESSARFEGGGSAAAGADPSRRATTFSTTSYSSRSYPSPHARSRSRPRPSITPVPIFVPIRSSSPPATPTRQSNSSPAAALPIPPFYNTQTGYSPHTASAGLSSRASSASSPHNFGAPDSAFYDPLTPTSSRPRFPSHVIPSPDRTSLGISVRDSSGSRDVARAAYGPEGVTVSIRSAHRPEDVEVSWSSSPRYDDAGRLFTTWEIRIVPKRAEGPKYLATAAASSTSSTPFTTPSPFSDYHLGSLPPARDALPTPASPRTASPHLPPPLLDTANFLGEPYVRERKTSTVPSEPTGSSFSSESSGPTTPRRSKFEGGVSSAEDDVGAGAGARRESNYRVQKDRLGLGERSRSVPSISHAGRGSVYIVHHAAPASSGGLKSPHHRFGCYIPSVTADVLRRPSNSGAEEDDDGGEASPEVPMLEPPSRRGRHRASKSESALAALARSPTLAGLAGTEYDDEEEDEDEEGPTEKDVARAGARGRERVASKWSDTDGDTDEENEAPATSWSSIPDASDESS